jgi:hypothetical protein
MAGTFSIVTKKTGEGGVKQGYEVKRVEQLLYMAGYKGMGTPNGVWKPATTAAWVKYQEEAGIFPARPFIEGYDPENKLLTLAQAAGVAVPLPSGETGAKGVRSFIETAQATKIPYGWLDHGNGSMMTWGMKLNGDNSWGICTKPGGPMNAVFDMKVPIASNCTSLANVLLSIWHSGNLHNPQYSASQASGGLNEDMVLGRRYGYVPLKGSKKHPAGVTGRPGMYTSLEEIQADTKPGTLYHFAFCKKDGFITHDTVLLDGTIYECNFTQSPACYGSDLEPRWKKARNFHRYAVVYGPAAA